MSARSLFCLVSSGCLVASACSDDASNTPDAAPPAEVLDPEPAGAPSATASNALTDLNCLGNNAPDPLVGTAVELTGYVRTLADPTATAATPGAQVEAFSASGSSLGTPVTADTGRDGRAAVTVPATAAGFTGHVMVTGAGFLDYRFQSSRPITSSEINGFGWLVTQADVDSFAAAMSVTVDPGKGILLGAVHDCDSFGVANAVVQVAGATDTAIYASGPTPGSCPTGVACSSPFAGRAGATFTDETGRFAVVNVDPGAVTVKAFGRVESGGPLILLSSIQTAVAGGQVTAMAMEPRVGSE